MCDSPMTLVGETHEFGTNVTDADNRCPEDRDVVDKKSL